MNDTTPQPPSGEGGHARPATDRTTPDPTAMDAEIITLEEQGEAAQAAGTPEPARSAEAVASTGDASFAADEEAPAGAPDAEDSGESRQERLKRLEEEGDIAADYLEELLDIADLDGDIDIDVDGDRASVEIRGAEKLKRMNEPRGELLDALQELTRLAVQTRTGDRSRLMLDICGFRAQHKESLEDHAADAVAQAKSGGSPVPLRPMNPFERKVVHDVAKREGLRSESDGDGKDRHVVIYPAS